MNWFAHDLRYALRQLARSPAFTAGAVATLALAIGATAAVFSVARAVLFRPLPVPEPDRLVYVWETNPDWSMGGRNPVSSGNFMDWRDQASSFDGLAALSWQYGVGIAGDDGTPARVLARRGSPEIFRVVGIELLHGRVPGSEAEAAAEGPQVLLGHGLWMRRYGGDPSVVGRTIDVNETPVEVAGVLPPEFGIPALDADLWFSVVFSEEDRESRRSHQWQVLGRLAEGVPVERAQAEMEAVAGRLRELHPEFMEGFSARIVPLRADMVREVRPLLLVLLGVVAIVLLVALSNVANLLTARGLARRREMAVRRALGAGRRRLVRQLLTESAVLTVIGGTVGLLLAVPGTRVLVALAPADIPLLDATRVDAVVLAVAAAVVVGGTFFFGLVPVLRTGSAGGGALRASGTAEDRDPQGRFLRGAFLGAQVALSVVLLVAAGLLLRSFVALQEVDPGFETRDLLAVSIDLPFNRYDGTEAHVGFYSELLERVEAVPGVVRAAGTPEPPVTGFNNTFSFVVEGRLRPGPNPREDPVEVRTVTPGYFRTMGIPLVRGRPLEATDGVDAPRVAVINEALQRRLWPDGDPVGARISFDDEEPRGWVEIVGVAGDTHHYGLDRPAQPAIYVPHSQKRWGWMSWMTLMVRTTGDPTALVAPIRSEVWAMDDRLPIHRATAVSALYRESQARRRFAAQLLAGLAGLALLLGAVGIYSVVAYAVTRRRREFGIRMALGAGADRVAASVLRDGVRMALWGVAAGSVIALAFAPLVEGLLFEVPARDPVTLAAVVALLTVVAAAASWIPARRAMRVEPMAVLREE